MSATYVEASDNVPEQSPNSDDNDKLKQICEAISQAASNRDEQLDPRLLLSTDCNSGRPSSTAVIPRPFKCPFCEKCFTRRDTLKEHVRTHTKEKPFPCKFCDLRFPTHSTRNKHERTHIGDKRYKCPHCELRFSGKPSLNYHLMVHSGTRPFKCNDCGKTFIQNSHLTRHLRVHTGEKPYKCEECGMKFVRNTSLQNHMRKHTGEILFTCQHCDRMFQTKEAFDYHIKTHTGVRPHSCSVCGWAFIKASHLRRHLSTHKTCEINSDNTNGSNVDQVTPENRTGSLELSHSAPTHVNKTVNRRMAYTCTYCVKEFAHKRSLESHLLFHAVVDIKKESHLGTCSNEVTTLEEVDDDERKLGVQMLCDVQLESEDETPKKLS